MGFPQCKYFPWSSGKTTIPYKEILTVVARCDSYLYKAHVTSYLFKKSAFFPKTWKDFKPNFFPLENNSAYYIVLWDKREGEMRILITGIRVNKFLQNVFSQNIMNMQNMVKAHDDDHVVYIIVVRPGTPKFNFNNRAKIWIWRYPPLFGVWLLDYFKLKSV